MNTPTRGLVRQPSGAFAAALAREPRQPPIDLALAHAQHAEYVAALRTGGLAVTVLPGDPDLPDCCFVEDMAVVAGDHAVLTRCSAPSRSPEQAAVAAALGSSLDLIELPESACIDGGDVLRLGRTFYVGLTERTTGAGFEAFAAAVARLGYAARAVPVVGALHLKCHATPLSDDLVAVTAGFLEPGLFADVAELLWLPPAEAYAANLLPIGCDRVLVAAGFPRTADALDARGLDPVPLATSEFAAADGSLTCLSILY